MSDQPSTTQPDARDVAQQEKEQITGTAKDSASAVGDTAARRGQELKDQARGHARELARSAQRQLRSHAQQETERAGTAMNVAADRLRALADGRIDEAGVFGTYVEQAADVVGRWADTVNDRGFDGLFDDLRSLGRRRPGAFLGGALLTGVLVGRFGRNIAQELQDDDQAAVPSDRTHTREAAEVAGGWPADEPLGGGTEPPSVATGASPAPAAAAGTMPRGVAEVPAPSEPAQQARPAGGERVGGEHSDDMIVGYASDDHGVVVDPAGRASDEVAPERPATSPDELADDDLGYRSTDADQGWRR